MLDDSAFKDVVGPNPDKFRVFSAFTTFVYSQLQIILPDSFRGDISDWDHFLSIDFSSPKLPLKMAADFLRISEFAMLVVETPTHFVGLLSTELLQKHLDPSAQAQYM